MRPDALARRAEELAAQGAPFVTATVVRAQRPTSARAGNVALVLSDGTVDGFVGGVCAEHSVRMYALKTMETGEPVLLRILPEDADGVVGDGAVKEDGAVTVQNTCLSGGAIEVFLEPVLPAPRVIVVGDTPIAGALERFGPDLGLDIVSISNEAPVLEAGDLGVVVAAHGRGELDALTAALAEGVPYVGLVASEKRGAAIVEELREGGVDDDLLAKLETPAGIEIGAQTPSEIAITILARIIQVRRSEDFVHVVAAGSAPSATLATDPICGMSVPATPDSIHLEHDGETVYFCREACKEQYEADHGLAEAKKPAKNGAAKAEKVAAPAMAVDPICGMTVAATPDTPHLEHNGETVYFCCEGCKKKFEQEQAHAVAAK